MSISPLFGETCLSNIIVLSRRQIKVGVPTLKGIQFRSHYIGYTFFIFNLLDHANLFLTCIEDAGCNTIKVTLSVLCNLASTTKC
jgi:hypothetical protein